MPKPDPLAALGAALSALPGVMESDLAPHLDAALKSAVRAVIPGRQQKRNLGPLLHEARKAFVRTLRRRAKR